jgi:hypothetical protein
MNTMIQVTIENVKPAMILAKAVYNHQESLLLDAGAKITEKNIRMFKSWGVAYVWVKGDSPDAGPKKQATGVDSVAAIEIELAEKFADVMDNPVMVEIMQAASRVLSKRVNEQVEEQ